MSIATEKHPECLQPFQNPNKDEQVSANIKEQQQKCGNSGKKSIDSIINSEQHVTKLKQFARQTPVVAIETEAEKVEEGEEENPHKEQEEDIVVIETFRDIYNDNNLIQNDDEDYQIYQDGNVNEFFNSELLEKPKTISDICLVNDHYILVKMMGEVNGIKEQEIIENALAPPINKGPNLKIIRDETIRAQGENSQRENRKLCRYLRTKRNRITRIAPIQEESEDYHQNEDEIIKQQSKLHCLKMHSCWQANEEDIEVYYNTQTTIRQPLPKALSANQKNSQNSKAVISEGSKKECTDTSNIPTLRELPTISGSLLKSSLQRQVSLHNYGSVITKESNNNNNNNYNSSGIENYHKSFPTPTSSPPPTRSRRKCPRFENFYWLLRPFRGKYRKPKPKIQAVVYKTYFVKWTKPPDTLTHGYGVKSSRLSDMEVSVLRRCRSAIF